MIFSLLGWIKYTIIVYLFLISSLICSMRESRIVSGSRLFVGTFGLLRISDTTVWATWSPICEDMHMNEEILVLMHTTLDCLSVGSSLS